jgi:glycosyltransferase involved in cell wall biosynthesis
MKIGIMLRHLDQHGGGVLVYTENLLRELLALKANHEFLLMYKNPAHLGRYTDPHRVREVALPMPHRVVWDQVGATFLAKRERVDLIFNPKYSIPLVTSCRTVWVSHGLDWYVEPKWSSRLDRLSHRYLVPRYAAKADKIIAVSEVTRQHLMEFLSIGGDRVDTVYLGVDERFRQPASPADQQRVRTLYDLPTRFFLYCGQIYPPKNFGRLVQAFAQVGPDLGIHLVVAGQHTLMCESELALVRQLGLEKWVHWPGWVSREDLPALYALAESLVLPSLYESFCLPLLEAMASGCPVVTANRYATKELADGVGHLVDPEDVESIADGMRIVATDTHVRRRCIQAGRRRASEFSWRKCATETLRVLDTALG